MTMTINSAEVFPIYLDTLKTLFINCNNTSIFPCIKDLAANGLQLERFSNAERIPSRQDVTQYLAAWFNYSGLSSEACQEWMIEYCMDVLSAISASSKSKIRHSTKSNIKYIYTSDVTFNCNCEKNPFKTTCEPTCPVYKEMADLAKAREAAGPPKFYERKRDPEIIRDIVLPPPSVKDEYRDQFKRALEVAQDHLNQWVPKKKIVTLLNADGFKTRTGKKWSYSTLVNELRKRTEDDPIE
jgi:hypothetical protein